jgi:hypothetical protein
MLPWSAAPDLLVLAHGRPEAREEVDEQGGRQVAVSAAVLEQRLHVLSTLLMYGKVSVPAPAV